MPRSSEGESKIINVIKFDRVELRKPFFDPNPQKSMTNNHAWRIGLFIVFKDSYGKESWYMPKYSEIDQLLQGKLKVEQINKDLARTHHTNGGTRTWTTSL